MRLRPSEYEGLWTAASEPVFVALADPDIPIWRYMDFTKFVAMLEEKALFFARADKLGDPFEGSYARKNEELRPVVYAGLQYDPSAWATFYRWVCQWTMISCWHMNEHESAAMWKLYAKTNEAIAIRSTYALLRKGLDDSVHIAVVKYIDYGTKWLPEGNAYYPFVHKRVSFAHERELRAITGTLPTNGGTLDYEAIPPEHGVWIPIDLRR
ncbi:MAG: DUF2971 domain-containing protein [Candidatus Rokubacteria bacterium]|nr:DUF2971 domain-containing protein [Candidatus Rokubacteria bacterium]